MWFTLTIHQTRIHLITISPIFLFTHKIMKTFLKFAFSGIALATLAACGGGGNDTATPDTTTNAGTVAATSAAIFIPEGSTSKVIQFASCSRTSNSNPLLGLSSPGGTLTIAANGDITVAYTDSGLAAVGATPAVPALNINRTFLHNTAAYSRNDFQMFVVERNNGSTRYRFSVDRNSEAIRLYASGGVTRTFENYIYFNFNVNGTNETLECGYVTNIDPAIAANIRDYNARIASFTTPLRGANRCSSCTTRSPRSSPRSQSQRCPQTRPQRSVSQVNRLGA
jgi:hypothetical protein